MAARSSLSRGRLRVEPSKLIDAAAARLIEQFREPRDHRPGGHRLQPTERGRPGADARGFAAAAAPAHRQRPAAAGRAPNRRSASRRRISTARMVGTFRVIRCIQVLDDSELYQARAGDGAFVALKIARSDVSRRPMRDRIEREATILRRLDGSASRGSSIKAPVGGLPFLAMEWISGIDAITVGGADLRQHDDRQELLKLILAVARAYATLHGRGVLHGDIHPGQSPGRRDGTVTLIDFGLALDRGGGRGVQRPARRRQLLHGTGICRGRCWIDGVPPPATLRAASSSRSPHCSTCSPPASTTWTSRCSRRRCSNRSAPRRRCGSAIARSEPWPGLETVLGRALSVEPAARYPDMSRFADALASLQPAPPATAIRSTESPGAVLDSMLNYLSLDGPLYREGLPQGPLCSVNFGAAGIAYALYHLACQQDDARLLAAADAWIMKAQTDAGKDMAFANPEMEMTEATVGRVSPYHAPSGLHLVQALIGEAAGENAVRDAATNAFLDAIDQPCFERDLTLGICGTVLGCGMLLELRPNPSDAIGEQSSRLRGTTAECPVGRNGGVRPARSWHAVAQHRNCAWLGRAALRDIALACPDWPDATPFGSRPPGAVDRCGSADGSRCGLAVATARRGRRCGEHAWLVQWVGGHRASGLCRGASAGRRIAPGDSRGGGLACLGRWRRSGGPCCEVAGRAYALLELHRSTGLTVWLDRAQRLASRSARTAAQQRSAEHPRHSLYKGELGLAVLIADLERPMAAAMPMFGWPG